VSQTPAGLGLVITAHPTGVTLSVSGDLDLGTAPQLTRRAAEIIQAGAGFGSELTVDLANVEFCDSVGISALVGMRKRCDEFGWLLKVVHPQSAVRRMLVDFTGLGDYLNVV
jgi:anti-sigma B factor antagonist